MGTYEADVLDLFDRVVEDHELYLDKREREAEDEKVRVRGVFRKAGWKEVVTSLSIPELEEQYGEGNVHFEIFPDGSSLKFIREHAET